MQGLGRNLTQTATHDIQFKSPNPDQIRLEPKYTTRKPILVEPLNKGDLWSI